MKRVYKERGENMKNIISELNQLLKPLKQGLPVICRCDNSWYIPNKWISLLQDIFGLNKSRLLSVAHVLNNYFDTLERIPIKFNVISKLPCENEINYYDLIEVTQKLISDLSQTITADSIRMINLLKRKLIGLKYRLELPNTGTDLSATQKELPPNLQKLATEWKKQQNNLIEKHLREEDITSLNETSRYPLFCEMLLQDQSIQNAYFEWVLRDNNPIAPFIEFPHLQQQLVDCSLNGRISRFGGGVLRIQKIPLSGQQIEKVLTLPIEGKPVSLLDENLVITFRGNYQLSIREILEIFKNKIYKVGNLEYLAEGIINWNTHQLGWWDANKQQYHQINLENPFWWNQLPLLEKITPAQASKRYTLPADGIKWIVGAKATRGSPTLDYEQTHAFMELAIPSPRHDSYTIYSFGKFAFQFPSSIFNCLSTFCLNMHATIAYPDENIFFTFRQHGCYPFLMNEKQGFKLMKFIKDDMIRARGLNLVFQIESENCAKWLYEKLSLIFGNDVPDFFRMSLMKTQPTGVVGACFTFMRTLGLSEMTQFKLLTLVHIPFGAGKGTRVIENGREVIKTLKAHEFWETSIVFLPALLVEKIHSGELPLWIIHK